MIREKNIGKMLWVLFLIFALSFILGIYAFGQQNIDHRGKIRMLYGTAGMDTLTMSFSGDTNKFASTNNIYKFDGRLFSESLRVNALEIDSVYNIGDTLYFKTDSGTFKAFIISPAFSESDPIYAADSGAIVKFSDTTSTIATQDDISGFLETETDPIFAADSVNILKWNDTINKIATQDDIADFLDAETDPIFAADSANILKWNDTINKIASQNDISGFLSAEVDPIFAADSAGVLHWPDTLNYIATQNDILGIFTASDIVNIVDTNEFISVEIDSIILDSAINITTGDLYAGIRFNTKGASSYFERVIQTNSTYKSFLGTDMIWFQPTDLRPSALNAGYLLYDLSDSSLYLRRSTTWQKIGEGSGGVVIKGTPSANVLMHYVDGDTIEGFENFYQDLTGFNMTPGESAMDYLFSDDESVGFGLGKGGDLITWFNPWIAASSGISAHHFSTEIELHGNDKIFTIADSATNKIYVKEDTTVIMNLLKLPNSSIGDTAWLGMFSDGTVFADTLVQAGFALTMELPTISSLLDDRFNDEIGWYYKQDGVIKKHYGLRKTPSIAMQQLQGGIEFSYRYIDLLERKLVKQQDQIEYMNEKINELESRINDMDKAIFRLTKKK